MLLKQRRNIGIDDDIAHRRQASEAFRLVRRFSQELFQFRVRLPDICGWLPGISHRPGVLGAREILNGDRPVRHRLRFLVRLAHVTMVRGTRRPALDVAGRRLRRAAGLV